MSPCYCQTARHHLLSDVLFLINSITYKCKSQVFKKNLSDFTQRINIKTGSFYTKIYPVTIPITAERHIINIGCIFLNAKITIAINIAAER